MPGGGEHQDEHVRACVDEFQGQQANQTEKASLPQLTAPGKIRVLPPPEGLRERAAAAEQPVPAPEGYSEYAPAESPESAAVAPSPRGAPQALPSIPEDTFLPPQEDDPAESCASAASSDPERPPELTAQARAPPPADDMPRVLQLITELAGAMAALTMRLDRVESGCLRWTDQVKELAGRVDRGEHEQQRLAGLVGDCEAEAACAAAQKASKEALERCRAELVSAARDVARQEAESLEKATRWQMQILHEDLQKLRQGALRTSSSSSESSFSRTLSSWQASWRCLNPPWCQDGGGPPPSADKFAEISTAEADDDLADSHWKNGAGNKNGGADLLEIRPCLEIPSRASRSDRSDMAPFDLQIL